MGIKELSLELAAVSLIADEAKKAKDRLKAALQAEMDAIGADRVKAEYGDDVIAYVTTSKPKFKWVIKNEREFVKWVKNNISSEIVETVRESSRDAILDKFNFEYEDDRYVVIDPNGEVVDWLEGTLSDPYLTTKFHSDGRDKLRDAIIGNQIDAKKVLELEG
jgi:hypothetical protein